jgi:hypothetical protein
LQYRTIAIKGHSASNEACASVTAIATNASVKDFCVIMGSNVELHRVTINIVNRRSGNKNIVSTHHE